MAKRIIEQMIKAVNDGYKPRSVFETSLTFHPGSQVKVNKDTVGKEYPGGSDVSIPKGSIVSIVQAGAGPSGKDNLVMLPDGSKATVAFYDLGEDTLQRDKDEFPNEDDDKDKEDPRYVKVELAKPLSPDLESWLDSGYKDVEGIELPSEPYEDQDGQLSFLMKAKDQGTLSSAIGKLKDAGLESIQKIEPASEDDWDQAQQQEN